MNERRWKYLNPNEKILAIERHEAPHSVDPHLDLIKHVAEITKTKFRSKFSVEELVNKVKFVDTNGLRRFVVEEYGDALSDEQVDKIVSSSIEMVSPTTQTVYFKTDGLPAFVEAVKKAPKSAINLGSSDPEILAKKSILFHAFSHVHESKEESIFSPVQIALNAAINRSVGFHLSGVPNSDEKRVIYSGANEAMTDYSGRILCRESGQYIQPGEYGGGMRIVQILSELFSIADRSYLDLYQGTREKQELFNIWTKRLTAESSEDRSAIGHGILGSIALRVQHPTIYSEEKALEFLTRKLNVNIQLA